MMITAKFSDNGFLTERLIVTATSVRKQQQMRKKPQPSFSNDALAIRNQQQEEEARLEREEEKEEERLSDRTFIVDLFNMAEGNGKPSYIKWIIKKVSEYLTNLYGRDVRIGFVLRDSVENNPEVYSQRKKFCNSIPKYMWEQFGYLNIFMIFSSTEIGSIGRSCCDDQTVIHFAKRNKGWQVISDDKFYKYKNYGSGGAVIQTDLYKPDQSIVHWEMTYFNIDENAIIIDTGSFNPNIYGARWKVDMKRFPSWEVNKLISWLEDQH